MWHCNTLALGFSELGHHILLTRILLIEDGIPAAFTSAKSIFSRKALVKMQPLKDVVGNDTYRINNKYDETYPPLPMEEMSFISFCCLIPEARTFNTVLNNSVKSLSALGIKANQAISTIGFVTAAAGVFSLLGLFPKRQRAKYY
ncbi:hras-like suppressor [Lynx pardinus]|uniref:Hras-like suppressor n=1 Tax=Lynx pardinus TaxID=191816 RepID=A0A485NR20_LYNPA|nr:hras-like suppressor [Lynx pardinus]